MRGDLGRAVFLDRDGVLIADVDHLVAHEQIRLLPQGPEALARFRAAGWRLIIATNQSVVARAWITEERLAEIHQVLRDQLRAQGADVDAIYYCPHHPEGRVPAYRRECACRKPNPGMLLQAAHEWHLDLARSVLIGDALSDIEAGRRAGCRTVLIRKTAGRPASERGAAEHADADKGAEGPVSPDYIAADLWDGAEWILTHLGPKWPG